MQLFLIIDYLSFLLILGSLIVILFYKKDSLLKERELIIFGLLVTLLFHHFSNILQWGFNMAWIDTLSGYIQILQPIIFGFYLFSHIRSSEISRLRNAEKEVRELNRFREEIIQNAKIWLNVLDKEGNILVWNRAAEKISGYSKEEVVGQEKIWKWLYSDTKYRQKITKKVNEILEGGEVEDYETTIETKSGEEKIISWTSHPLRNEVDEIIGSIAIGRDVTEKKEAEKREEFLQSLFTHDLRNQAQVVLGYLELIKEDISEEEKQEKIEKAIFSVKKTLDLADKLRKTISVDEAEYKELNPKEFKEIIKEAIKDRRELPEEKDIEVNQYIEGVRVMAGPLIKDVVVNLLDNAIQHSNSKKINIKTKETEDEAIISVEDDGKGLTRNQKNKIFDRKYTQKPTTGGLGLPLIEKILETYNGRIEAKDSELGGARFDVHLQKPKK